MISSGALPNVVQEAADPRPHVVAGMLGRLPISHASGMSEAAASVKSAVSPRSTT